MYFVYLSWIYRYFLTKPAAEVTRLCFLCGGERNSIPEYSHCISIEVNRHQGKWEGRNFEVTSTELRWTGQEAGKNRAILTKDRNASCHLRRPNTTEIDFHCRVILRAYEDKIYDRNLWKVARKRKSRTSLKFTFNLNTLYLASILFTWLKFTVNVRSQKRVSGNQPLLISLVTGQLFIQWEQQTPWRVKEPTVPIWGLVK